MQTSVIGRGFIAVGITQQSDKNGEETNKNTGDDLPIRALGLDLSLRIH